MDCIFCKIANKELPATVIYEDKDIIAFDDIHPKAPFHKLIIPRQHIATLNDAEEKEAHLLGQLLLVTQKLAKKLGIAQEGYRVLMNVNKGGGQVIFHVHLHLLGGHLTAFPG